MKPLHTGSDGSAAGAGGGATGSDGSAAGAGGSALESRAGEKRAPRLLFFSATDIAGLVSG
jgi:hypothetical protein